MSRHDPLLRLFGEPVEWMRRGACRTGGARVSTFFVADAKRDHEALRTAKAWCELCPVREECLGYALAHPALLGIWGGMTETQRLRLRRERKSLGVVEKSAGFAGTPTTVGGNL